MSDNQYPAWHDQLPDDLKGHETLAGYQKLEEAARAILDLQGKVPELEGKLQNAVMRPGEAAKPEELDAFYNALGRPEKPEAYSFGKPEGLPEGIPYDENLETQMKQVFHSAGLNDQQGQAVFKAFMDNYSGKYLETAKQMKEVHERDVAELKRIWGDDVEEMQNKASRAATKLGGERFAKYLKDSGLGQKPIFIHFLNQVFELIGEDSSVPGAPGEATRSVADSLYPEMAKKQQAANQ